MLRVKCNTGFLDLGPNSLTFKTNLVLHLGPFLHLGPNLVLHLGPNFYYI